jgi:hypothetical protein
MIDFVCCLINAGHHAIPIYTALPEKYKGTLYCNDEVADYARDHGVRNIKSYKGTGTIANDLLKYKRLTVVNSYGDNRRALMGKRQTVFGEHGVGYTFGNGHESYAGSKTGRSNVVMFLCQNEHVQRLNQSVFPKVPCPIIGIPKMDAWTGREFTINKSDPLVCLSFHWDCHVHPFTRSCWRDYIPYFKAIRKSFRTVGHAHPRHYDKFADRFRRNKIKMIADFREVMERVDVYINDSSSTIFEFAYLNKPVVLLNSDIYPRDKNLNARFWQYKSVGVNVDDPATVVNKIREAITDTPEQQALRKKAVEAVFTFTDGKCAERAVNKIISLID